MIVRKTRNRNCGICFIIFYPINWHSDVKALWLSGFGHIQEWRQLVRDWIVSTEGNWIDGWQCTNTCTLAAERWPAARQIGKKDKISGQQEKNNYTNTKYRVYFKQDLQLHKAWQEATWQCNNCTFYTAHFDFTTAQIVINCTLKYALTKILDKIHWLK